MTWSTPPGPYTTNQIYPSADTNTNQSNFEVLEAEIGLYGAAGARYVAGGGSLPSAGMKVQWLVQTQGFYNFTAGASTFGSGPGIPYTTLNFPAPFPAGGGVAYVVCQMRISYNSGTFLYTPANQAFILDDTVNLSGFGVVVYNVNTATTASSGSYSASFLAVGWQP